LSKTCGSVARHPEHEVPGAWLLVVTAVTKQYHRYLELTAAYYWVSAVQSRPTVTCSASARSTTRMVSPVRRVRGVG
jgi:hypothetical protein